MANAQQQQMKRDLQRLETAAQVQLDELSRCVEWLGRQPHGEPDSEQVALDVGDSSGAPRSIYAANAMVEELERHLQQVRLAIQRYASTSAPYAVIQSHTGRADDLSFSLRRLKGQLQELSDRDALLGDGNGQSAQMSERYDQLVRERSSIAGSQGTADDLLAQAHATRDDLFGQNRTLSGTRSKLAGAMSRFPEIQNLMNQIKAKKWKNKLILWSAVALCCCILVWTYLPAASSSSNSSPAAESSGA
jgi:small-conductance mechanosensitive channel